MKELFAIIIFTCCFFIGIYIKKCMYHKYEFFCELNSFIKTLKVDITFFKNKISEVIYKSNHKSKLLNKTFNEYLNYIDSKNVNGNIYDTITLKRLSHEEKNNICTFFNSLGKSDISSQNEMINGFENIFLSYEDKYKQNYEKYGNLVVKIAICFGLVAVIIMI